MIKIEVKGNCARVIAVPRHITAGTVGLPVEFEFDGGWDGLHKTAVFRAGPEERDVAGIASTTTVPWEVLRKPGESLKIGVYGTNEDGTKVTPTVWAQISKISPAARPCGRPSSNPPSPTWEALAAQIAALNAQLHKGVTFPVTLTQAADGSYSADKSVGDISTALAEKKICYAEVQPLGVRLALTSALNATAVFEGIYTSEGGASLLSALLEDVEDSGTAVEAHTMRIADADSIPQKISDLPNDAGYLRGFGYVSIGDAVQHLNNGTLSVGTVSDLKDAVCMIHNAHTGALTLTLLQDVETAETLTISKSVDLALNGHRLTFNTPAAYLNILEGAEVNIYAHGGAIAKTYTTAQTAAANLVKTAGKLTIHGGTISHIGNNSGGVLVMNATDTAELQLEGATLYGENTSTATYAPMRTMQIKSPKVEVRRCNITATGAGTVYGIFDLVQTTNMHFEDCKISADSSADVARGAIILGVTHFDNCVIEADATSDSADRPHSMGIYNSGTVFLDNCTVYGTQSGVSNAGNLYVSGGKLAGYSHGGVYLVQGANGVAYINDTELSCGGYTGRYDSAAFASGILASAYVGGSDTAAYFDGCAFGDAGMHLLVMRGTGGETNNTLNLSNCTIPEGTTKQIRIDAGCGHTLNIGIGGNITAANVDNSADTHTTGQLYRRKQGDSLCHGADFNAMLAVQPPLIGTTEGITPAQVAEAILQGRRIVLKHSTDIMDYIFTSFSGFQISGGEYPVLALQAKASDFATLSGDTETNTWEFVTTI